MYLFIFHWKLFDSNSFFHCMQKSDIVHATFLLKNYFIILFYLKKQYLFVVVLFVSFLFLLSLYIILHLLFISCFIFIYLFVFVYFLYNLSLYVQYMQHFSFCVPKTFLFYFITLIYFIYKMFLFNKCILFVIYSFTYVYSLGLHVKSLNNSFSDICQLLGYFICGIKKYIYVQQL